MKRIAIFMALAILVTACTDKAKNDPTGKKDSTASSSGAKSGEPVLVGEENSDTKKYFNVESGMIEMKNSATPGTQTLYFDQYGARQAVYSDLVVDGGAKASTVQITAGGWVYSFDMMSKSGTKMKVPPEAASNPTDPSDLTPEQKKQYNYRELEPRTLLGKEAKGYAFTMNGSEFKVWIWEKVPFYMEISNPAMGKPIVMEATKFESGIDIDDAKFTIPGDVTITESPSLLRPSTPSAPSAPASPEAPGGSPAPTTPSPSPGGGN